jgi:hypothetical protein
MYTFAARRGLESEHPLRTNKIPPAMAAGGINSFRLDRGWRPKKDQNL